MHKDCHPELLVYAACKKLVCFGGEVKPFQHDKLWVQLPFSFEDPGRDGLALLHDKFVEMWPEGGSHKHRPPTEPDESGPQVTMSLKLDGAVLEKLNLYCSRAGYNRASVIRSLLHMIFTDADAKHAAATFEAWRKDAAKKLA
jgi:hypothetical protein